MSRRTGATRASAFALALALAGACAVAPPAPFQRTPDAEIATFPRAVVEPQPTRPEGVGAGQSPARVLLRVAVDRTGAVRDVSVLQGAGDPHDQDAIESMKRARFLPALDRKGQPVDCEITWALDYAGR